MIPLSPPPALSNGLLCRIEYLSNNPLLLWIFFPAIRSGGQFSVFGSPQLPFLPFPVVSSTQEGF